MARKPAGGDTLTQHSAKQHPAQNRRMPHCFEYVFMISSGAAGIDFAADNSNKRYRIA
jgi:hypothetical protein